MPRSRIPLFATVLIVWTARATAQAPIQPDSARAQIHTSLRSFYFNLAHHDWEALTADILAAKVVAHHPAPEALLAAASAGAFPLADGPATCSSNQAALVDQAIITLEGSWAEVSVPRCPAALAGAGADEFRLIHFEERWRFVYIALFGEQVDLSTDR